MPSARSTGPELPKFIQRGTTPWQVSVTSTTVRQSIDPSQPSARLPRRGWHAMPSATSEMTANSRPMADHCSQSMAPGVVGEAGGVVDVGESPRPLGHVGTGVTALLTFKKSARLVKP